MSVWAHVNCSIRMDSLRLDETSEPNFEEIIGRQIDPLSNDWKTTLPCGSEGALTWHVWTNPHENHLAAYVLSIFGDLRDYNSFDGIELWFTKVCEKVNTVRSAILEVEIESYGVRVYRYNPSLEGLEGTPSVEKIYERMFNNES